MAYKVPTLEELLSFVVAMGKGLMPTRNFGSRFSQLWKLSKIIAGVGTDIHAHVDVSFKDFMPDTTSGSFLDRWLGIVAPGGLDERKGATPARGTNAGRVFGTAGGPGGSVVVGDQLLHRASGLFFEIAEGASIAAGTSADVDIAAVSTGSATRLKAGELLEFQVAHAGLSNNVKLVVDLTDDGVDSEQDGAARVRLLSALGTAPAGGNQTDYVNWLLAVLGVSQAFSYPNRAGLGTVDVVAFHAGSGTARFLSPTERTADLAMLELLAPSGVAGTNGSDGLRVLTAVGGDTDPANLANVETTISTTRADAWDWDDTGGAPVVFSYVPATKTLRFSAARPPSMIAGGRLSLKGLASSQDGAPMYIDALASTDSVILRDIPAVNPVGTDLAYAGGDLATAIRTAILAHINGDQLFAGKDGPLVGSTLDNTASFELLVAGIGPANPSGLYGEWCGSLLVANLRTIMQLTRGVRNCAVITPAVDQDAVDYAFPLDAQIGQLTPGYVLVRRG